VLIHRTDIRSGHIAVHAADPRPKGAGESQWVAVGSHYPVLIVLKLVDRIFVALRCAGTSPESDGCTPTVTRFWRAV
jgi:hypothetical protein